MKRDLDLVRTIMLAVEESPKPQYPDVSTPEGYDEETFEYHVGLLGQAGLLETRDTSTLGGVSYRIKSLTWKGHEFLDAVRQDTVWEKTKSSLGAQITSVGLEVIKGVANNLVVQQLKGMGVSIG